MDVWLHDLWRVGSRKAPNGVAGSVSDVRAGCVIASVDIINERFIQNLYVRSKSLWQQQSSSAELSQSQATTMPRRVCLCFFEQVLKLFDDLISKILCQSLSDPSQSLS